MSIRTNFKHTIMASYIGYITQAIVNNFAPLLFLTFHNVYKMNQSTGPATGDVASISYGFVMMIVSAATLIALLITDREKKEEIKE